MTVAARLVADLEAAALGAPILPPGTVGAGALPAIAVVPADSTIAAAGQYIEWFYDVTPMVARDNTVAQLTELEALTERTVAALVAAGWSLGTRIRYVGGDAEDLHHLARTIPVSAPGPVNC